MARDPTVDPIDFKPMTDYSATHISQSIEKLDIKELAELMNFEKQQCNERRQEICIAYDILVAEVFKRIGASYRVYFKEKGYVEKEGGMWEAPNLKGSRLKFP